MLAVMLQAMALSSCVTFIVYVLFTQYTLKACEQLYAIICKAVCHTCRCSLAYSVAETPVCAACCA